MSLTDLIYEQIALDTFRELLMEQPVTPNANLINQAIKDKSYIGIYYEEPANSEIKSGYRLIAPHAYGTGYVDSLSGQTSHEGDEYIRAFVIMDSEFDIDTRKIFSKDAKERKISISKSRKKPYWRLFRVDRIKSWEDYGKHFTKPRLGYKTHDKNILSIKAEI